MKSKLEPLDILINAAGFYTGYGINHEDKQFKGLLEITPVVNNKGVNIKYRAVGLKEEEPDKEISLFNREMLLFSEEHTLIAYNTENKLCLYTLNSNVPTVCVFDLRRFRKMSGNKTVFIFGFGERGDNDVFREEISIEILGENNIGYNYFWGEPGGLFLARSSATLKKI